MHGPHRGKLDVTTNLEMNEDPPLNSLNGGIRVWPSTQYEMFLVRFNPFDRPLLAVCQHGGWNATVPAQLASFRKKQGNGKGAPLIQGSPFEPNQ